MAADSHPAAPVIADVIGHDTHQRVMEDILDDAEHGRLSPPAALHLMLEARNRCEECGA